MKLAHVLLAGMLAGSFTVWGCGGDDDEAPAGAGATAGTGGTAGEGGTGGTAGEGGATGGTGGTAGTGGTGGTGGTAGEGGTGGEAGTGGSAGEAGSGGGTAFWDDDYDPSGSPDPADGKHQPGTNCMTCHNAGALNLAFGGTVYQADGTTPAPHVEVGVRDGSGLLTSYTGDNGNFWVLTGTEVDWANAEVRFRNANGDVPKATAATASCNQCHTGGLVLTEP